MLTSQVKTYNSKKFKAGSQTGFALIEILTALFLVSIVLLGIPMAVNTSDRSKLEDAIDSLDRAVRFATNEAVLKNSMVRLRLDLEKNPVEYFVEVAPNGGFVLPKEKDTSKLSLKELEREKEKREKLDSKFNKVEEFKDTVRDLDENVSVIGLANSEDTKIKNEGNLNIYFYPTGERDSALILLATREEVASIDILPFQDRTNVNFEPLKNADELDDPYEEQLSLAKEMVDKWISK